MANVSSVTKHFPAAKEGFTTTLSGTVASGAATVGLNSVTGYTNGETVVMVVEPGNPTNKQAFTGVVDTAGVQITGVVWTEGTNVSHAAGSTVADYVAATHMSMVTKGIKVEHSDDGTHSDITADSLTTGGTTETDQLTIKGTNIRTGWFETGESWAYASFDAATDTGTITVPTDATTKYSVGMRIKITQSTGGTKYGIITKVASTVLTIYFGTDYTLNNEAITAPDYSTFKAPLGFPLNLEKWTLEVTSTTTRNTSSSSLASLTDSITVPIGAWTIEFKGLLYFSSTSTANDLGLVTLSSDASTETHPNLSTGVWKRESSAAASSVVGSSSFARDNVTLSAQTTFLMMGRVNSGADAVSVFNSTLGVETLIRAVCAYL